jgi:hypothetical protein
MNGTTNISPHRREIRGYLLCQKLGAKRGKKEMESKIPIKGRTE